MWLVIQIALGIALGYALIQYHQVLIRRVRQFAGFAFFLAMYGLIVWAVSTGFTVGKDYLNTTPEGAHFLAEAIEILAVLLLIALLISGFAGLGVLFDGFEPAFAEGSKAPWYRKAFSFLVAIFLLLSGFVWVFPIFQGTLIGDVNAAVGRWSRSNAYGDLGPMALYGITYQWPWLVWFVARAIRRRQKQTKTESGAGGGSV